MSDDKQRSTASGVFWGLVLFFIVLPIGATLMCSGAVLIGAATQ